MRITLLICALFASSFGFSQERLIKGRVVNEQGRGIEALITIIENNFSSRSDTNGVFTVPYPITLPSIQLSFRSVGYQTQSVQVARPSGNLQLKNVIMQTSDTQLGTVVVSGRSGASGNMQTIDAALIQNIPSVSGNFESVLKTLPGVSTNNELSSQYSVRGGNFDENLIYINDIELFRPLLIRNGQQEGLSFINPELVSKATFSAGGFEARYGDKMSSVLDIKYGAPDSNQFNASAGLLGLSATSKLAFKNSYLLFGVRQKTNQSVLSTQEIKGIFSPKFYDVQAVYGASLNKKISLSAFGNYNLAKFNLTPQSRETVFGTLNEQMRLNVNYQGQEKDLFESVAAAVTITYKPYQNLWIKWLSSAFSNLEQETFDIEGRYIFDEASPGQDDFTNVRVNRGIGTSYEHARNRLKTLVYSSELRAFVQRPKTFWEGGLRYQRDQINDRLNEYLLIDSAGFTIPETSPELKLSDVMEARNSLSRNRVTAYLQNTLNLGNSWTLSAGMRANFNSFNNELFVSPRIGFNYRNPATSLSWRFSAGSYNQSPFYREMRNYQGNLVQNAKSQRSIHVLAAADYLLKQGSSPVKFTSEIYYKALSRLTPYKIENLRLRYFAGQLSHGYAVGADFAVSSEFVEGLESSFRLSLMKTAENIEGDSYQTKDDKGNVLTIYPGYLKRPTDQRINFSAFFQDKLLNDPSYKVHLTILYGAALPTGPPRSERYQDRFKIPAYKRVDIAFSKDFLDGRRNKQLKLRSKLFDSFIAYAEVFNLLNIRNTVSFLWIKDVNNNQYAIPNYLTSRQLNLKIIAKFKN